MVGIRKEVEEKIPGCKDTRVGIDCSVMKSKASVPGDT